LCRTLFDRDAEKRCRVAVSNEFRGCCSARADFGSNHCCHRSSRSATAGLLRFVLRGNTCRPLSPFPSTELLTARNFDGHPRETDLSGPRLMDWSRRSFQKPIPGMERDEILEKILVRLRSENFC